MPSKHDATAGSSARGLTGRQDSVAGAVTSEPNGAGAQAAIPASEGRVPDFFIVGHEKCGTTALYKILKQHPQIFMPELKEPRFLVIDPRKRGPGPKRPERPWTLEAYLRLFAAAAPGQRAGEASPQYIRSTEAAGLIAQLQPAAKIIAILREPTSFLRTYHFNTVRDQIEPERDLRKAIALEEPRRQGKRLPPNCAAPDRLFYCEHVRYVEQLRRFEAALGREQMMVLIYEDFRHDNDAAARAVMRFLGVDDSVALEIAQGDQTDVLRRRTGGRKAVRLQRLHRAGRAIKLARRQPEQASRLTLTFDALTRRLLRNDLVENLARRAVFTTTPSLDEGFPRELRRRFKPEVQALSEYLERDLVGQWGYDSID
jgi:hypothetical protein